MNKNQDRTERVVYSILFWLGFGIFLVYKRLYPFGNLAIAFPGDSLSQYLPSYYYFWDVLHGKAIWDFSWELGMGSNMAGGISHFYLLNPYLLLIGIVKRDAIPYMMTLVFGLTVWTMGFGMLLFLQKDNLICKLKNKEAFLIRILCGLAYACSLHSVMYLGMGWPITGMFVPYLMLFLNRFFDDLSNKKAIVAYIIVMAYIFCLNIPQAYALCLYLILYVGFILLSRKASGEAVRTFIIGSIIALGLSMFRFMPSLLCTMDSYRYGLFSAQGGLLVEYHHKMAAEGLEPYRKVQMLYFVLPVFIVTVLILALNKQKITDYKKIKSLLIGFNIVICLPLVVEVTNIMWNNGPYVCFPVRHGYLIYFTILVSFYYAFCHLSNKKLKWVINVTFIVCFYLYTAFYANHYINGYANTIYPTEKVQTESVLDRVRPDWIDSSDGMLAFQYRRSMLGNYYPLNTREQLEANQLLGYQQKYVHLSDRGGSENSDLLMNITGTMSRDGIVQKNETALSWPLFITLDEGQNLQNLNVEKLKNSDRTNDIQVKRTSISCDYYAQEDGYILLPIYAGKGWKYRNNQQKTNAVENSYYLMMLPVSKGKNYVEAKWQAPGKMVGSIISFVSIWICILFMLGYDRRKILILQPKSYIVVMQISFVLLVFYIYVIPVLYRLLRVVKNIILS